MSYFWEKNQTDHVSKITVLLWSPVGHAESSFGHMSVVVTQNDTDISYSLGPKGCDVRLFQEYSLLQQKFRTGYAFKLKITDIQAQHIADWMANRFLPDGKIRKIAEKNFPADIGRNLPALQNLPYKNPSNNESFAAHTARAYYNTYYHTYYPHSPITGMLDWIKIKKSKPTFYGNICDYSLVMNNCVAPIRNAFIAAGLKVGINQTFPVDFAHELWKNGLVEEVVKISGCIQRTYPFWTAILSYKQHPWDDIPPAHQIPVPPIMCEQQ